MGKLHPNSGDLFMSNICLLLRCKEKLKKVAEFFLKCAFVPYRHPVFAHTKKSYCIINFCFKKKLLKILF